MRPHTRAPTGAHRPTPPPALAARCRAAGQPAAAAGAAGVRGFAEVGRRGQRRHQGQGSATEAAATEAAAAEKAAAEATKGGKKSNLSKNVTTPTAEEEQAPPPETSRTLGEVFKSQDEDPSKSFDFLQFQKIMSEIPSGKTSVGSILGAMVFQISNDNALTKKEAMKEEHYVRNKPTNKRMSTRMIKLASS